MFSVIARSSQNLAEDWMVLAFLLALVLVVRVRLSSIGKFKKTLSAFINVRIMRQVMREETSLVRHQLMLLIVFCLMCGMLIYLTLKYFNISIPYVQGLALFLTLSFAIGLVYSLKSLFLRVISTLANGDYGLEEYHHNVFLSLRVIGLVLIPMTVFFTYAPMDWFPIFIWIFAGIGILAFFFRTIRGVLNSLRSGVSLFYIFFYICTFEILPILVFYKALLA